MHYFSRILIITVTVVILTLSLALAGTTFPNKDTAKDRKDSVFGTDADDTTASTTFQTGEDSTTIKSKSAPAPEEVDWYNKIIITVNPDTKWPASGSATTTSTSYNNSTDTQTTTTTTEEYK